MKNKIFLFSSILAACLLVIAACTKTEEADSVPHQTSRPYVAVNNLDEVYIYLEGHTTIYNDIPDTVAIVVDTVYGFEGGYGGKTGHDNLAILKSDVLGFDEADTVSVGGTGYFFQKYSKGNYRITIPATVIILDPASSNANPGPTNLEGVYRRTSNGYLLKIREIGPGFYLLGNPGGAASVTNKPYFLYNSKNISGGDSLSFAIQTDLCDGGLQLVAPTAPLSLSSAEYSASHPPIISSMTPITLQWRVYEFPTAEASAVNPGAAICTWGTGVRTFEKQ